VEPFAKERVITLAEKNLLGYKVCKGTREACVAEIFHWVLNGDHPRWLACLNPHSFVTARKDDAFRKALNNADLLIPDGMGIVLASRILGGGLRERVTGSDMFQGVHERLNREGEGSVFFLGSTEATLAAIRKRMAKDYPSIRVAGTFSPPFKSEFTPEDDELMIKAVNDVRPDILWVGMTAPKQEKWIHRNKDKLNVKFIGAVGAVFDYYAGNVKRAPAWARRVGLEWLYRWIQEPRRLWIRNVISTPIFLGGIIKEIVRTIFPTKIRR